MRSLQEVIKAIDICMNGKGCENCPYAIYDEDGFEDHLECYKPQEDSLEYLKQLEKETEKKA